jgi:thioredoxin-like negative regulator of GroEL
MRSSSGSRSRASRADDAEGFLALAAAQLRAGQRDEARATIAAVLARDWLAADEPVKRRAQELLR